MTQAILDRETIRRPSFQPDPVVIEFPTNLPTEDGEPLETPWHRVEINLLIEALDYHWRDRSDYYCGGNMFIYFSADQARNRDYRGPDFYVVKNVPKQKERLAWIVWEEDGRYPDVIIELLSPSTRRLDKTIKKDLYEQTFRTAEYFCYDPDKKELLGWRLNGKQRYHAILPDKHGRLWSEQLQLWLDKWEGEVYRQWKIWLRFFTATGELVLRGEEDQKQRVAAEKQNVEVERQKAEAEKQRAEVEQQKAEAERQRADDERQKAEAEKQRADLAEAELASLKAELNRLKQK